MLPWKIRKFFNFFNIKGQKNVSTIINNFQILKAPQDKKILFIGPHPDDETIAAGGFLFKAARQGCDIFIILISGGEKWGPKDIRLKEFYQSCKTLKIKTNNIIFLNFPDKYSKNAANRVKIFRAIKKFTHEITPNMIIYPSELDLDKDHKTLGQLLLQLQTKETLFLSYLIHYVAFPKPYRFRPNDFLIPPLKLFKNNKWVSFTLSPEELEKKHEAMLNYRTQLSVPGLKSLLLSFIRRNEIFIERKTKN